MKIYETPEIELIRYNFEDMMDSIALSNTETAEQIGQDGDDEELKAVDPL